MIKLSISLFTGLSLFINTVDTSPKFKSYNSQGEVLKDRTSHIYNRPDKIEIPFEIFEKKIFVKGELNGKPCYFKFDSGSELVILNSHHPSVQSYVDTLNPNTKIFGARGIHDRSVCKIDSLNINGLRWQDTLIDALPLKSGSDSLTPDIAGLIGYPFYKDYGLIEFDYNKKVLILHKTDSLGAPIDKLSFSNTEVKKVPILLHRHIPIVTALIDTFKFQFGLDCGAGANLMFAKHISSLGNNIENITPVLLTDGSSTTTGVKITGGKIKNLTVSDIDFRNMFFAFEDNTLNVLNQEGFRIDGLLGYDFFKKYKLGVNYASKELWFHISK